MYATKHSEILSSFRISRSEKSGHDSTLGVPQRVTREMTENGVTSVRTVTNSPTNCFFIISWSNYEIVGMKLSFLQAKKSISGSGKKKL